MKLYKICKIFNDIKLVKCLPAILCCFFLFPACTGGKTTWTSSKIQDSNDVESLIAALSDKNPKIRSSAAIKLQKTNDYRAVEPLISASKKDEDLSVRVEAAIALGKIRDPRAVESLIAALNNRKLDPESAALAARSLGEIKDPRAIEPLIAAYNDYHNSYHLRIPAGDALVKIGPPAIAPLISALKGYGFGSDSVRETAIRLVKIGRPAVDALIVALKDKHPDVRSGAAYALGEIKDPRAVGPLIIALKDKDKNVRKEAVDALAKIGRPAVEPLIVILKDTDLYDSAWAAWALGKMNMNHQTIDALFGEKYSTAYSNYHTLIKKGEKGNDIAIIFALARYGDKLMAENILNSNNKLLTEFAQKWAWDNGYTTSTRPAKQGETMQKWGRK